MKLSNDDFNIEFTEEICKDIYALQDKDNSFCVFNSIHGILCIVYPTIDFSKYFMILLIKPK